MNAVQSDGATLRQHLEAVEKMTKRKPEQLQNAPELPLSCLQVWNFFTQLNATRTSAGFGANPIQYSEILAFFTLEGYDPEAWEIDLIRKLDIVALTQMNKKPKESKTPEKKPPGKLASFFGRGK